MAAAAVEDGPSFSAFLGEFLEWLSSPSFANSILSRMFDKELLQRLEATLYDVQAVVNDADHKQTENPAMKKWFDYLKDAVHLADDLLNQLATKSETRHKVSQLTDIIRRLESIVEHADFFGLKEISMKNLSGRTPKTSSVNKFVYGRDQDKEALVKLLLDDNSDDNISVIPIVGMGGIGKTTLAQMVYSDDNLKQNFDLKAWVDVSDDFDIIKVTKTIIEEVSSSTCNIEDLNLLQLHLKEKVSGRKLLLVLDDFSNENYHKWETFMAPFQHGIKGSKILVTTRSERVCSIVSTLPPYELTLLTDKDSWSLFANLASLSSRFGEHSIQEKIGIEIVRRCKGLPLAIQLLGGLLQTLHEIRHWNSVLKSDLWESEDILPALEICYHYLPAHLKRCFAFCSLYPHGYKFNKDELVSFWMSHGLLQSRNSEKTLEEVGYEYFDDLVSRSFLQHFSFDSSCRAFVMHDLIRDLAIFKAYELRTFLPLDFTDDMLTRILSSSGGTPWIQILSFPSVTLPTISSPSIPQQQWMISIRIRNLRIRLELWRLMGFMSSGVGLLCQALSPSFTRLIGGWDTFKFFLYGVVVFIICITTMFANKSPVTRCGKIKVHVGFGVLMLTSMYSFFYDRAMNGKPDLLSVISNGAFALMSLSLSRVLKLGFEVGLFAFFLGSFVIQLMTIKRVLVLVAIIYGLPLYLIHSCSNADSDYLPSVRILDE